MLSHLVPDKKEIIYALFNNVLYNVFHKDVHNKIVYPI